MMKRTFLLHPNERGIKMTTRGRLSLAFVLLLMIGVSTIGYGLPNFSDQNIAAGNLNPTDRILVQEVRVTGDSTHAVILTAATVQNMGTAGSGQIDKIEIWDGGAKLGETTNIAGLPYGVTVNLGGYNIPSGSTHYMKIYVTVGTSVSGGETVNLRVKFYYQMNGSSYASAWISDLTGETIRNGGFDQLSDTALDAEFLNPNDEATVQVAVFTDNDANGNDVLWAQTGSNTIVKVENLGTATTADVKDIKVTLTINGTDYTWGWGAWAPGSPMEFNYADFTPAPADIPDNSSVTVTVEMRIQDQGSVTDGRTIRTRVTLLVKEGGQSYEQTVTSSTTQTIRKQGFEEIEEDSTSLVSGTMTTGSSLEQTVKVTDDDVNADDIRANKIYIRNLGTASGDEIHQIQVKAGATTLVTITQPNALFDNFKAGMTIPFTTTKLVADDGSLTLKIYYEIGTPVDGHTVQPVVKIQGRENGVDYWSDEVTYPDSIALYQPGFETVENVTPPEGGTAYSGQRFLAQKIRLVDQDENDDDVTIGPIVVKNTGTAQASSDVVKIEIWRQDPGADPVLLGEATNLAGLRTAGVTISTPDHNVVTDKATGAETFLNIYVTIAEPEQMTAGRTVQLRTRVLHTEAGVSYDKAALSNQWTLAINHRPVPDFTFKKASTSAASAVPKADFTYQDTIKFTGTATDPDGDSIVAWHWDFGDGTTSDEQNPTHQYPNGGTFDVTLTVTDDKGLTGSVTKTITVEGPPNEPPVVDFTWSPSAPDVGEEVTFTPTVTDPDTPFTYAWDFGDGTTSQSESPKHSFAEKKAYTVTLTVTDSRGGSTTVTKTLSVGNEPPVASFTVSDATPVVGETVQFTDTSSDPDGDDITAWQWDFGDETTADEQNPTHAYTVAGTYTVSLVVTDAKGGQSTAATQEITVTGPSNIVTYAYPNPATATATIVYYLPEGTTDLVLRVYDLVGNLVYEHDLAAAESTYDWDLTSTSGDELANGLYFYVVTGKDASGKAIRSAIFKLLIQR